MHTQKYSDTLSFPSFPVAAPSSGCEDITQEPARAVNGGEGGGAGEMFGRSPVPVPG